MTTATKTNSKQISPNIKPETLNAAEAATVELRSTLLSMMEPGFFGEMILKVSVRDGNITLFEVDRKRSHKIG